MTLPPQPAALFASDLDTESARLVFSPWECEIRRATAQQEENQRRGECRIGFGIWDHRAASL